MVEGYLGSGKTTLLNYILGEEHGKKSLAIVCPAPHSYAWYPNSSAADIEKTLTVSKDGQQVEEWLELANGDSGVNAIESLMERRGAFDYILLETTGLADPGNIAPLFWVDEGLGSTIYLDGIITLVDAANILRSLDEKPVVEETADGDAHRGPHLTTAHLQVSHADVLVINKADLVPPPQLQMVRERIQAINSLAKIHITQHGRTPRLDGVLLDLHAYDDVGSLDIAGKGHSHLDPGDHLYDLPHYSTTRALAGASTRRMA
ncbi:MAG: hypothetical protein M1838_001463 [Thelocarpon superellum]|nr:MAG: hypothetical protein M1838_001463 [Thelocarpon superellum]